MPRPPVVIVGGGVAGVATALALGRQGRRVLLLEQADQIGAIGYGVQIGPNVQPQLEALGIAGSVLGKAFLPSEIRWLELDTGNPLAVIPLRTEAFDRRYGGCRYFAIHRVDLHELLLGACQDLPTVEFGQSTVVTGWEQDGDRVWVTTADGDRIEAAAVVAADGLRSRLRARMHPGDAPRDTGYVAFRTIVPMAQAPAAAREREGVTMWSGPGFHIIYYPLRHRTELNIVMVLRVPAGGADPDADVRALLDRLARSARPEPRELMGLVSLERRWSIADREPVRRWADGRVTLIGDAAHATLQSLAQGAGMAIEDAVALARLLEGSDDYAAAFRRLERLRYARTARVQLESRALWETYHCEGAEAALRARQWGLRGPDDFYRCLDWLWNPQPPAAPDGLPDGHHT